MTAPSTKLPYEGLRVIEFSHMVMGPTCGLILADLGAEVIKIEPPGGDKTRRLLGSGAGFYPLFNRNKRSLVLDLQSSAGRDAALRLIDTADVVSENFKPSTMKKLGLDYDSLKRRNPKLIFVSHKGFLPGPYENRTALDEVVQMMGGLAYMTGRPGDPLRAGASVNDIMGGMFGAIGVMAALAQRQQSGLGQQVQTALFENNVFLVAQHIMQLAATGEPARPMPLRISAWAVYDVFDLVNNEQIFLGVVTDKQWFAFCQAMKFLDLLEDPKLNTNNDRVRARDWLLPILRERLKPLARETVAEIFERAGLPFAPILAPHELLDDPHLQATLGLTEVRLTDGPHAGETAKAALLPLMMDGSRLPLRHQPPTIGEDSIALLQELGYSLEEARLLSDPK